MPRTKSIAPDIAQQRRRKLTALEEAVDVGIVSERQRCVRELLRRPLLVAGGEAYRLIRTHGEWLREWFTHHVDWQLTITAEAARLRKTPAMVCDGSRPCRDPKSGNAFSKQGYVYLCLAMAALIRSDRQTTLGTLCEELGGHLKSEQQFAEAGVHDALSSPGDRRDLVGAVRVLIAWGVLSRVQGDEDQFLRDAAADVLYNVCHPVLARVMAATQAPSLVDETRDFEAKISSTFESVFRESEESRHRFWRTHLFRRLLDDPVLYYASLDEDERTYLDRQRGSILDIIEKATGLVREVRAEGIAMVDPTGQLTDYKLPEDGTEGHLTLLLAEFLSSKLRDGSGEWTPVAELETFTAAQIAEHSKHWRKSVVEPGQDRILTELVVDRLAALSLLRREGDRVEALPALGRYALVVEKNKEPETMELNLS